MPVKIRCRGCEKVLNAPDKAKGRVIKCPSCGTKLKVPGDKPKSGRPAKPSRKSSDSDDFLSGLDFNRSESEDEKVCPFCAEEMDPEASVCRACGMNVDTGMMDRREAKRRSRRGPDPAKFYKKAWSDSWEFLLKHWKLAIRTGVYWALFAVLLNMCVFMMFYSRTGPPKFFWFCMTFLSMMGFAGWYWFLALKLIESTMNRDEKMLEYIDFDIFQTIAVGLRAIFWPYVISLPLLFVFGSVSNLFGAFDSVLSDSTTDSDMTLGLLAGLFVGVGLLLLIILLGIFAFSVLVYPLALVHMTQKYTYKAWILWEMLIVAVKNLGPALYFWFVALVLMLPVILMVFAPLILLLGLDSGGNIFFSTRIVGISFVDVVTGADPQIDGWTERAIAWCLELVGERPTADSWLFRLILVLVNMIVAFMIYFPVYMIVAFPAVFMMKVNGVLAYYNRERLGLVNHIPENTPANFWVRFLATLIDGALWPLATLLVLKEPRALFIGWVVNVVIILTAIFLPIAFPFALVVAMLYYHWMYFAVSESSATRTTIGKDAFGLIVNDLDNKQISMGKATLRWLGRIVCSLTLNAGFLVAAFHPEKRGLHDLIAGTRCCWRGDR